MYSQDYNQENWLKNTARCDEHISIFDNNVPSPVFFKKSLSETQGLKANIKTRYKGCKQYINFLQNSFMCVC